MVTERTVELHKPLDVPLRERLRELIDNSRDAQAHNLLELRRNLDECPTDYHFTPVQWEILLTLGENIHQITDHNTITGRIFGRKNNPVDNVNIRNQIKYIRRALPSNVIIQNLPTRGYKLTSLNSVQEEISRIPKIS